LNKEETEKTREIVIEEMTVEFFAQTFDLPAEDLVGYCSCSLWQNLIRKGALYISLTHVCFFSAAIGKNPVIKLSLPFTEVTLISNNLDKVEIGLIPNSVLIPNSIRIDASKQEYFLTNFSRQKDTYTLLRQLWILVADEMLDSLEFGTQQQSKKQFSTIHKEKTLKEWLSVKPTIKEALEFKKKNEEYHMKFRVPMEETIQADEKCSLVINGKRLPGQLQLSQQYGCFCTNENEPNETIIVIPFQRTKIVNKLEPDNNLGKGIKVHTSLGQEIVFVDFEDFDSSSATIRKKWGRLPPPVPMFRSISFKNWQEAQNPNGVNVALEGKPTALSGNRSRSLNTGDLRKFRHHSTEKELRVEYSHLDIWLKRDDEGGLFFKNEEVKSLVRKGLHDKDRAHLWFLWSGALFRLRLWPGHYSELLKYYEGQPSVATQEIEKDLHRSFPEHPFYQTEEGLDCLRRVLTGYSWRNQAIGYCQSMNIAVAILLLFMTEEESFWTTCCICEELLPGYYDKSLIGAAIDQRVFEDLLAYKLPDIYHHLKDLHVPSEMISLPWFMCLYIGYLPLDVTIHILDILFYEGREILFKVGLALFKLHERTILMSNDATDITIAMKQLENFDSSKILKVALTEFDDLPLQRIDELYQMYRIQIIKERMVDQGQDPTTFVPQICQIREASQFSVWVPKKSGVSDAVADFLRNTK